MSLRSPDINYDKGWLFVTSQVAHNKSALGAIVGEIEAYILEDGCKSAACELVYSVCAATSKTIRCGKIRPGGSLETLLNTYQSKRVERI